MTEKEKIVVDDVEHTIEDLTQEQQAMVNHVSDLDRKLSSARFNVDQLSVGREAFVNMLARSLEAPVEPRIVDEDAAA